ncbi:MAG: type I-E CRISPR-associated protein Cse2/CasB [Anaerolineae bacterium]
MHESSYDPRIVTFVERLARLDAGERARLKRNAGKTLAEARDTALALFYRLLPPEVPEHHEETYFLVATLYPLAEAGSSGNLGDALRQARTMTRENPGLDRRVRVLLDADATQLPFRLRQTIHYLASTRVPINWTQLLQDLLAWNHPRRWVQREWARAYFVGQSASE